MSKKVKRSEIIFKKEKIFEDSSDEELRKVVFYQFPQFPSLGGYIDFFDCIPELGIWLKKVQDWPEPEKGHIVLAIHGFMKVGKTAVLKVIPQILPNFFSQFQVCSISFEMFPITSAFDFFKRFYYNLGTWMFDTFNYPIPILVGGESLETFKLGVERILATISKNYEGHVFYLFDEIQRWFQLPKEDIERAVISAFFKNMVGNYPKQYFAITGSGMATAWEAFLKAPASGHRLAETIFSLDIPGICNHPTLEWCANKLNAKNLLPYAKNPAQLIFLNLKFLNAKHNPSNTKELEQFIQSEVDVKYTEEFIQDMFPLLQKTEKSNRQHLRRLALGLSTESPKGNWKYYLSNFVNYNVPITGQKLIQWNIETNNAPLDQNIKYFIGLKSSLFSTLVTIFINPDGSINEVTLNEWSRCKCLPLMIQHFRLVDDVANIGSLCSNIESLWYGKKLEDSKEMTNFNTFEKVCKSLFQTHNYELNLNSYSNHQWFQLVLNYAQKQFELDETKNNYAIFMNNVIKPNNSSFDYWYCTLFKLTKDHYYSQISDLTARKNLVDVFPPWITELVNELIKEVSFLHTIIIQ